MPRPDRSHLKLIDTATGEITEYACAACGVKEHEIDGLTRKMRGLARENSELRRDKEAEAANHELRPVMDALFAYWQEVTGHTRVRFTYQHFWSALPMLKAWGVGNCAAAIAGIAYDPNTKPKKNGKGLEVYNDWETVFRNAGNVRRYIERRPAGWTLPENFYGLPDGRPNRPPVDRL